MTPPIESFPASELPVRVQLTTQGRLRKNPINLAKCDLMEVLQYSCHLEGKRPETAIVKCEPIVRLFRRFVRPKSARFPIIH